MITEKVAAVDIFRVSHEYFSASRQLEPYMKKIGCFFSEDEAEAAIVSVRQLPGFTDYPDAFRIERFTLNAITWADGFDERS